MSTKGSWSFMVGWEALWRVVYLRDLCRFRVLDMVRVLVESLYSSLDCRVDDCS